MMMMMIQPKKILVTRYRKKAKISAMKKKKKKWQWDERERWLLYNGRLSSFVSSLINHKWRKGHQSCFDLVVSRAWSYDDSCLCCCTMVPPSRLEIRRRNKQQQQRQANQTTPFACRFFGAYVYCDISLELQFFIRFIQSLNELNHQVWAKEYRWIRDGREMPRRRGGKIFM